MRVKDKDDSVFLMLESERNRCIRVVEKICGELKKLPKGSLGKRKVKRGGREYVYPCLRYRNDSGVKFEHLSPEQAEGLKQTFEKRKKLRDDLKATRKRLATLDALLRKGKGHENRISLLPTGNEPPAGNGEDGVFLPLPSHRELANGDLFRAFHIGLRLYDKRY